MIVTEESFKFDIFSSFDETEIIWENSYNTRGYIIGDWLCNVCNDSQIHLYLNLQRAAEMMDASWWK